MPTSQSILIQNLYIHKQKLATLSIIQFKYCYMRVVVYLMLLSHIDHLQSISGAKLSHRRSQFAVEISKNVRKTAKITK